MCNYICVSQKKGIQFPCAIVRLLKYSVYKRTFFTIIKIGLLTV